MRVVFNVYSSAFQTPGGGEVQLLKTKEYLEKLEISPKLFNIWQDKVQDYQILHTFGSVKYCLGLMQTAHALGVKNVLSTICWYSWKSAWGIEASFQERAGAVLRHATKTVFPSAPSLRKTMMEVSDLLLPNSETEASQLCRYFNIPKEKIAVIPNGVDPLFEFATSDAFREKFGFEDEFFLCVGRIEPRKNQLQLVRALSGIQIPLVFIGKPVHEYRDYYETCRREAGSNVHFLGGFSQDSSLIASAYAACTAFVLPSWLETPGLAALEAGLAGANVLITGEGAAREYFKDFVEYVNPSDRRDIRKKVIRSLDKPRDRNLQKHIKQNYLWSHVAEKTLEVYEQLLQSR